MVTPSSSNIDILDFSAYPCGIELKRVFHWI
jgi:hypothetical protein